MTAEQFEGKVNDFARFSHMVLFTDHALERMKQRGITRRQVLRALTKGSLLDGKIKWDTNYSNWTGKIRGIAAGEEIDVPCAILDGRLVVKVLTAI